MERKSCKIIHVHFLTTHKNFYFGSVAAIFKKFSEEEIGYSKEYIEEKFGAMFNAFQFGAPPHAGIAPGVDRMVMLIANSQNIREIIAFPKNKKARDAMMNAPSRVDEQQLKDVHIRIVEKEK